MPQKAATATNLLYSGGYKKFLLVVVSGTVFAM
jgi:hypothetical protein